MLIGTIITGEYPKDAVRNPDKIFSERLSKSYMGSISNVAPESELYAFYLLKLCSKVLAIACLCKDVHTCTSYVSTEDMDKLFELSKTEDVHIYIDSLPTWRYPVYITNQNQLVNSLPVLQALYKAYRQDEL